MARPYDWTPLASADPTPGNPDTIEDGAKHYRAVAEASEQSRASLETLMRGVQMDSDAVRALEQRADEVYDSIESVSARYNRTARALELYIADLREVQRATEAMLTDAQEAERLHDQYDSDAVSYRASATRATANGDDDAAERFKRWERNARSNATTQAGVVRRIRDDDLPPQVTKWNEAAEDAIRAIDTATNDGLNDGWWENWGADLFHIVSKIATAVATVAGILALVLCWVPGLNAALAAVAAVAGAVALVADAVLAMNGEKGWGDFVMGAIGLVTLGVGRAVTPLVRASLAARGTGASTALVRTSTSEAVRVFSRPNSLTAVGIRITRAHHGDGAMRAAFTPQALREAAAQLNPATVLREAGQIASPAAWRNIPQAMTGLRGGGLQQVASATFDPATAARMFPPRATPGTGLVPLGAPLPNTIQVVAGHQGGAGTYAIYGMLSFDALVGTAPQVASLGTFAAVSTYDAYQTIAGGVGLATSGAAHSHSFGTWMTGNVGTVRAPHVLNLR